MVYIISNGIVGSICYRCNSSGFEQYKYRWMVGEIGLRDSVRCGFGENSDVLVV